MIKFWNIVYYFAYRGDHKLRLLFDKYVPLKHILRIPLVRNFYAKRGVTVNHIYDAVDNAFKRPDFGLSITFAGGLMCILIFGICFGLALVYEGILRDSHRLSIYHEGGFVLVSLIVNYLLLFRRDKYLKYFKELEEMKGAERRKWAWISFAVIFGILLFAIGSFVFMAYRT